MKERAKSLERELVELESSDPRVREARARLDEVMDRIAHPEDHVKAENLQVFRCEEYSSKQRGICDAVLDEHGNCPRAYDHGDHLNDR